MLKSAFLSTNKAFCWIFSQKKSLMFKLNPLKQTVEFSKLLFFGSSSEQLAEGVAIWFLIRL